MTMATRLHLPFRGQDKQIGIDLRNWAGGEVTVSPISVVTIKVDNMELELFVHRSDDCIEIAAAFARAAGHLKNWTENEVDVDV